MQSTHRSVLLAVLIGLFIAACGTDRVPPTAPLRHSPTPAGLSSPTPVSQLPPPADITGLTAGQAPSYRGITPGISHKSDVLAQMGEPNVIRAYGKYECLHYFSDSVERPRREEHFWVNEDIVQAVTSTAPQYWLTTDGRPAVIDDLHQLFGTPVVITPTLGGFPLRVFPQYGLAISDNRIFSPHYVPHPYQFFVPMEPQEYQALWGEYPLGYDPFPPVPSVEAVGIKPGETTRDRVAQLLGMPDRIMFEDRNAPWLYYVESDMLGSLRITFDNSGVVEDMSIRPDIIPYYISLGEIVEQYGDPDVVQLLVGFEGQKYENLGLLYLDRGLRVSASCVTPACNTVKRDGVVNQKWYFEATTLEGYQTRFSKDPDYAPAYIEWHGFDE